MKTSVLSSLLFLFALSNSTGSADMVPFVIPARQEPNSVLAVQNEPVGTERITVDGDHFALNGEHIKIWGVNITFSGLFPSHQDAPMAAERLAAAGINSVRFHHLDTLNYPQGIWDPDDPMSFDPEALDRLDYFINELARRGIYINMNLHVGRKHSNYLGLPDPTTDYDKMVGIFTSQLIDAQKGYAQDLLGHYNPYRGMTYSEDPAIAFVEITNEDSLFMWNAADTLPNLPSYYADILQQQYNDWLAEEYIDTNGLSAVWNAGIELLGDNVLTSFVDHFTDPNVDPDDKWYLEQHEGCSADFTLSEYQSQACAKFVINVTDDQNWHLQVKQANLEIAGGQYYTLSFDAVAEQPRTIWCDAMQDHTPWSNLGLNSSAELTNDWQTYTFGFTATDNDNNGRITFRFGGGNTTTFYLRNPQLRTGGQTGLLPDEFIENGTVRLYVDTPVKQRTIDRMRFFADTEKTYFDDMYSYIKNDVGCGALVTGTVVFGPLGLWAQSDMDFIDSHAYWQHPAFPGSPWDPVNWYINQMPMTDYIDQATLFGLAGCRLGKGAGYSGKPFTVSEYNHPAPLDSQASCIPMLASFAAAQDWDGLWMFDYASENNAWDHNYFARWFSIMHNPAKWGFVRAATSIFRNAELNPVGNTYSYVGLTDPNDPLPQLADLHFKYGWDMFGVLAEKAGISREDLLNNRIVNTLYQTGTIYSPNEPNQTTLDWQIAGDGKGIYTAVGNSAGIYVGHSDKFSAATGGKIVVTEPDYVAMTITQLDCANPSAELPRGALALITTVGRCENTGMMFTPDRTSVGDDWGNAPVLIEPVSAEIIFPYKGVRCYALDPNGAIKSGVATRIENSQTIIELSSAYETMWYLLAASGDVDGDGQVTFTDFSKLGQHWLQDEPSVDIAPAPFGDGVVDLKDLAVLVDTWLVNLNP